LLQKLFLFFCETCHQRELTIEAGPYFRCLDMGGRGTLLPCNFAKDCCVCAKSPFLCLETFCCVTPSVLATRRRLIHKYKLRNSDCDDCAMRIMFASQSSQDRSGGFGSIGACCCLACMLTQQRVELNKLGIFAPPAPQHQNMNMGPNEGMPGAVPMQAIVVTPQQQQQQQQQQQPGAPFQHYPQPISYLGTPAQAQAQAQAQAIAVSQQNMNMYAVAQPLSQPLMSQQAPSPQSVSSPSISYPGQAYQQVASANLPNHNLYPPVNPNYRP